MANTKNTADEINVTLKIADLAFLTDAMQYSIAHALLERGSADVKKRLKLLEAQFSDLIPIGKLANRCAYAWYEGFTALSTCKTFHVYLDDHPVKHYDRDKGYQFALIIDGSRYNLSERLEPGMPPAPEKDKLMEMEREMIEFVDRISPIDAKRADFCKIPVLIEKETDFGSSHYQQMRNTLTKQICQRLNCNADFYVLEFDSDWAPQHATIIGSPERLAEISEAFGDEPGVSSTLNP